MNDKYFRTILSLRTKVRRNTRRMIKKTRNISDIRYIFGIYSISENSY